AHAGLLYDVVPADGSPAHPTKPMWLFHWDVKPGQNPAVYSIISPRLRGLRSGAETDMDAATFWVAGQWSAQPNPKTGIFITNNPKFPLRLKSAEASDAKFDPPAVKEIAPGATASFASVGEKPSDQKLVYELVPGPGAPKGDAEPMLWTLMWSKKPG